jgi:hypothetical protein
MSIIKNFNHRPLPKTFEPLRREYKKLQSRFFAIRDRNNIEDQGEYYLILIELQEFFMNELALTEEKLLELGLDKNSHNEVFLNKFSKRIQYDSELDLFDIRDMESKDYQRWVKSFRKEKGNC